MSKAPAFGHLRYTTSQYKLDVPDRNVLNAMGRLEGNVFVCVRAWVVDLARGVMVASVGVPFYCAFFQ